MCAMVVESVAAGNEQTLQDARRVGGEAPGSVYVPKDAREFCGRIMHSCYMGRLLWLAHGHGSRRRHRQ